MTKWKWVFGTPEIDLAGIADWYQPVTKLEFNICAARKNLLRLGMSEMQIAKLGVIKKQRKGIEDILCDICKVPYFKVMDMLKDTPMPKEGAFGLPGEIGGKRGIIQFPPGGVIINYAERKVYAVCGFCQWRGSLKRTESGTLIHGLREGKGYVDWNSIKRLQEE
jgi:hypothetical protein